MSYLVFCVFPLCCCLVVSTSAINCLERLVSEMTCYVCVKWDIENLHHPLRRPHVSLWNRLLIVKHN